MEKKFKQFTIEQPNFSGERKMSFVVSTAGVDRDNDTIDPKGWDIENFKKNPVIVWAHDYSQLPVAKAIKLESTEKGLSAEIEFPPIGTYKFADTVHDMLKAGFLSATSVGFKPTKWNENSERKGFDFSGQELLEISIVPVPSNPEALITQRAAGIAPEVIKQWSHEIWEWMRDQGEEAAIEKNVLDQLKSAPSWKDFVKDMQVEMSEKKALPASRLCKLFEIHKLFVEQPAKDKKEAATGEVVTRLHPDDLAALAKLLAPKETTRSVDDFVDLEQIEADPVDDIDISAEEIKEVVGACTRTVVAEFVGEEVQRAINRLRGRVD